MRAEVPSGIAVRGRIAVTAVDSDWLRAHRHDTAALLSPPPEVVSGRSEGDNVVCTAGTSAIGSALVWSGIVDQAASLGATVATTLAPLYGAVGNGTGTVANTDTALFSELGRATVGAGAATPGSSGVSAIAAWLFFFPPPASGWTVSEAGLFAQATSATGSGTLLDHYAFPSPVIVLSPDTVLLQITLSISGS